MTDSDAKNPDFVRGYLAALADAKAAQEVGMLERWTEPQAGAARMVVDVISNTARVHGLLGDSTTVIG